MSFEIRKYSSADAPLWDAFVKSAWNGVFLFERGFMDYHADRFEDYSLLAFSGDKLKAVLPANRRDEVLHSHQGLTYGGWVLAPRFGAAELDALFAEMESWLAEQGFSRICYKQKPFVFDRHFSAADAWVLWKRDYQLWRRDLSFCFDWQNTPGFARDKRYRLNKSARNDLRLQVNGDEAAFLALVNHNLQNKYDATAVHSLPEVQLLQQRFPEQIKTFGVHRGAQFLGGAWTFIDNDFVHTQYFHFNEEGRRLCAPEFLVGQLSALYGRDKRYFSFGTSTEAEGQRLNEGLAAFKEGFGAAGFCHDFYRKDLCR